MKPIIEKATKIFLVLALTIPFFVKADSLLFPYTSGKVYLFRLFLFLATMGWLFLMIKDKKFRPRLNILTISLLVFVVAMVVTGLLGVDPHRSIFSNFERSDGALQLSFFVLYFLALTSVFKSRKEWNTLISLFLLTALIISIYSWTDYDGKGRLSGVFGNPAYFGAFLLVAAGFAAIMLRESFKAAGGLLFHKVTKIFLILLTIFFLLTLFYTGTRGCYAGLAAGSVLIALLSFIFLRKNKKTVASLAFIAVISLSFLASVFIFADHPIVRDHPILSRIKDMREFQTLPSIQERLAVWDMAVKGFQDKPVTGWGPENFGPIFNKYYSYRVGLSEPWFDRAHNQFLETLSTGGIVLFAAYLFLIASVFYLTFKITKKDRPLGIILTSLYFGYLVQGMFLFDTFSLYLCLFPLLGYVSFNHLYFYKKKTEPEETDESKPFYKYLAYSGVVVMAFLLYSTVWIPYKANVLAMDSFRAINSGRYEKAEEFFKKSLDYDNPFSYGPVRKRVPWQFLGVLTSVPEDLSDAQKKPILDFYNTLVRELENLKEKHPYDPQIYYVLGVYYREGAKKLGVDNLEKAELIFQESFNYSELRADYYNEYAKVLMMQGKYEEAENLIKTYLEKAGRTDPLSLVTMGHLYFVQGKYEPAFEWYEKAKDRGYDFTEVEGEYGRYLLTSQETGNYQSLVDMAKRYLKTWEKLFEEEKYRTDLARTYYNIAIGYYNLGQTTEAKDYFQRALDADRDNYEKYKTFFDNL